MSNPTNSDGAPRVRAAAPETAERFPAPRIASLLMVAAVIAFAIATGGIAAEYHSNPWLLSWIPSTCCVTNDCCWEVSERELKPMPDDNYEVVSTGQVRKRTDWSPDGKFYRCACDFDSESRHWIRHQGANTRCIFVPMRTAGL
jgi:hypothetical protein